MFFQTTTIQLLPGLIIQKSFCFCMGLYMGILSLSQTVEAGGQRWPSFIVCPLICSIYLVSVHSILLAHRLAINAYI